MVVEGIAEGPVSSEDVGITLMAGEEADAIVDLLKEQYGDRLRISDAITYVKVETDAGRIEIRFADVAELLGKPYGLNDFQIVFSSYYGRPLVGEDMIGVYSDMTVGVRDDSD